MGLQFRPPADGLPLLDQERELGGFRRGHLAGDRCRRGVGRRYGVHVCLKLPSRPRLYGGQPPEKTSLWTDAETQRVCARHWAMFARRYRGVPGARLSFDLLNEPAGVSEEGYAQVARRLVEAIRQEDRSA